MNETSSGPDLFNDLAHEFAERYRRGERPALSEYTNKYPELAAEIRDLFPALMMVEQFGSAGGAEPDVAEAVAAGPPPQQLGEYRILRQIRPGGQGVVYEAVQEPLGRHVALKVLPPALARGDRLERFRREARAAARLHHTNIVPVFGVGEHQGIHYYAMQFILGQDLSEVLGEVRRLRERTQAAPVATTAPERLLAASVAEGLVTGHFPESAAGSPPPSSPQAPHLPAKGTEQVASFNPDPAGSADGRPARLERPSDLPPALPAGSRLNEEGVVIVQKADKVGPTPSQRVPLSIPSLTSGDSQPSLIHSDMTSQPGTPYYRSVAQIGIQVADALDYAHRQKILHRDIKPSNLLLDTAGRVWVTDFGLAKAGDFERLTQTGNVLGTLRYMAPERFRGEADERSDVYGLGITLYELLTLRPAFEDSQQARLIQRVLDEEPLPPRRADLLIPRDLETVVLTAMAKEPAARYSSAAALAEDLRRFLADRPIKARRSSTAEKLWRWGRRNPRVAALLAVVVWLLLTGTTVSMYFAVRANSEAQANVRHLQEQEQVHQRRLYVAVMNLAHRAWQDGQIGLARQHLQEYRPQDPAALDLRGFEWYYLQRLCRLDLRTLRGHTDVVHSVAFSPDGRWLASGGDDQTVRIWDTVGAQETRSLLGHAGKVMGVAFSPDGRRLASASDDRTIKIWDTLTGQAVLTLRGHQLGVMGLAFSPDGRQLASASSDGSVRIWDTANGHESLCLRRHRGSVMGVAFSADGRRIASASWDGTAQLWDATTGKPLQAFVGHGSGVSSVVFSPDGKRLASASDDRTVRIWDAATGQNTLTLRGHAHAVLSVAFSPDGRRLASVSRDQTVKVWDVTAGQELFTLRGHEHSVTCVTFSPDGRRLATASADRTVKIWDAAPGQEMLNLDGHTAPVESVAFSPDGQWLASASEDCTVKIMDASTGQEVQTLRGHTHGVASVAFSPDGRRLASGGSDQTVKVWDVATSKEILSLRGHRGTVWCVAFSPDGRSLASASRDHTVKVWNLTTGRVVLTFAGHKGPVSGLAYSPDGYRLASASDDHTVKVWDAATGQTQLALEGHTAPVLRVTFSPDGQSLASASDDQTVKIWDSATGQETRTLHGHTAAVSGVAFSPDGQRLVSCGFDHTVKLWETSLGQEILTLRGHTAYVLKVVFSPDGLRLASGSDDSSVKIWDARDLTEERLTEREALSAVRFLVSKPLSRAQVLARIRADAAISESVRARALALAEPFWQSRVQHEAQALVHRLFFEPLLRPEVQERIARDGSLREPVRQQALDLARHWPEGAGRFNEVSWSVVRRANAEAAEYRRALVLAEIACRLVPDNASYLTTLGVAQYRLGKYQQAVDTLTQAEKLITVPHQGSLPVAWAFLAMAHWQLGEKERARQCSNRAVQWTDKNDPKNEELRHFAAEAEELLGIKDDQTRPQDARDTKNKP